MLVKFEGPCIEHIVLFKAKSAAAWEKIEKEAIPLMKACPRIAAFDVGEHAESIINKHFKRIPYTERALARGYTHAIRIRFYDVKALEAYTDHPKHEEAKKIIFPLVDDVLVFDLASPQKCPSKWAIPGGIVVGALLTSICFAALKHWKRI